MVLRALKHYYDKTETMNFDKLGSNREAPAKSMPGWKHKFVVLKRIPTTFQLMLA